MKITHATAHTWIKSVTDDPLSNFGKNSVNRLKSTLKKIDTLDIESQVNPIDESFLDWFVPMYEERINSKSNPRVFDIKSKTLTDTKKQYYTLVLREGGEYLGATIFSLPKGKLSIAYRTYSNSWKYHKLQANPSLYTEYIISKLAIDKGCSTIVHGKDKNPYGVNSSIGLAAFKLSGGSHPTRSKKYEVESLDTDDVDVDALIFEYPDKDESDITKGYLLTSRETENKWVQVTKYSHLINIEVIYRD